MSAALQSGSGAGSGAGAGQAGGASGSAGAGAGDAGSAGGASGASGSSSAGAGGSGVVAADWTTGLADEARGFVQNKGWKGPADVLTSYQNLEKLVGAAEHVVRLPTKDDDTAGWDGVYNRLGRPAKPEAYGFDMPKEGGNPEFVKWAKETFHGAGLSDKQAQSLAAKWNDFQANTLTASQNQMKAQAAEQDSALRKEWGMAYDQNVNAGKAAMRTFGIDGATIDKLESAMGFSGVMKFMQNIGSKVGEHSFDGGGKSRSFGALTPEAAKSELSSKMRDQGWLKKYQSGDQTAQAEMQRLQQAMNPGERSL